jgi:dolichol-phosphate mannosyltransferase
VIYILLPAYNEETSIDGLFGRIREVMEAEKTPYKIIVVNDGSKDRTAQMLEDWSKKVPLDVVTHRINRGLGETSRDLFERAVELAAPDDVFIRMDCDKTHDPQYIRSMVRKIESGCDVVIASRFQPGGAMVGVSAYRAFISRCANLFMKLLFPTKDLWEFSCGFRAYRAEFIQAALRIYGNDFIELKGLGFTCTVEKLIKLRNLGARFGEVPFVLRYDLKESPSKMLSSITTLGYLVLALKNIFPWGPIAKRWMNQARDFRIAHRAKHKAQEPCVASPD